MAEKMVDLECIETASGGNGFAFQQFGSPRECGCATACPRLHVAYEKICSRTVD